MNDWFSQIFASHMILNISESVASSRAQLRRVFWYESADDCEQLVVTDKQCI